MDMAFVDLLFQRGNTPILEAALGFAHQKQLVTGNNIANVDTPNYERQTLPEDEFQRTLMAAIEKRRREHPGEFRMENGLDIKWDGTHPNMPSFDGKANSVERHDENTVSLEQELATQAKNELKTLAMQTFFKKSVAGIKNAARDSR